MLRQQYLRYKTCSILLFHPPFLVNTIQYLIYKLRRRHQVSFHLSLALTAGCCNPSLLGPKIVGAACLKGVAILTLSPWQWQVWLCSFRQALDKEVVGLTCVIHLKLQQDLSLSSSISPKDLELFSVLGLMDKILGAWGMKHRRSITMWEGMWSVHLVDVPQHLKHIGHWQGMCTCGLEHTGDGVDGCYCRNSRCSKVDIRTCAKVPWFVHDRVEFWSSHGFNTEGRQLNTFWAPIMDPLQGEAHSPSGCLKEAHEIEWVNDPDDDIPLKPNHKSVEINVF